MFEIRFPKFHLSSVLTSFPAVRDLNLSHNSLHTLTPTGQIQSGQYLNFPMIIISFHNLEMIFWVMDFLINISKAIPTMCGRVIPEEFSQFLQRIPMNFICEICQKEHFHINVKHIVAL